MNNNNGWNGRSRTAAVGVVWSAALVVALGSGLPVAAAEGTSHAGEGILTRASPDLAPITEDAPAKTAADGLADVQWAQFQLPQPPADGAPARPVTQFLKYQYSIGSESDITYRRDPDLDKRVRDNFLILAPQINGFITYRPTDWIETTLEMIAEREIAAREEPVITLPNGETQFAKKRHNSLVVDQAFVRFHNLAGPYEFTVGRRNFEDNRHWLYDTSLDAVIVKLKLGDFHTEASASRKDRLDLDLLGPVKKGRINNYMLYTEYRGIEDHKLAGYAIKRVDSERLEGRPLLMGVRASGTPSDKFSYWSELALLRGKDEAKNKFSAHAFDVGGTYRFMGHPLLPRVTLGYAYATGDDNPDDATNHEFRQTGLQSNESKFGGIPKFKVYGEALDPELSNLKILTVGFGFQPAPRVSVDLVYHRYRLNKIASTLRNSALTAEMNQVEPQLLQPSKDVGSGLDIVIGFRNLFGVRRLGLDLRAGWFLPGKAFHRDDGTPGIPNIRRADKGISMLAKFWW
ncbi:MAG: alginate export family protein [Gammaproteobacteria bacterium]